MVDIRGTSHGRQAPAESKVTNSSKEALVSFMASSRAGGAGAG